MRGTNDLRVCDIFDILGIDREEAEEGFNYNDLHDFEKYLDDLCLHAYEEGFEEGKQQGYKEGLEEAKNAD